MGSASVPIRQGEIHIETQRVFLARRQAFREHQVIKLCSPPVFRRSVLARAVALHLMLLICTGTIITGIFLNTASSVVTRLVGIRAAAIAKIIADQVRDPMASGNWEAFESMATDLASLDGIAFIVVTAKGGRSARWHGPGFLEAEIPTSAIPDGPASIGLKAAQIPHVQCSI